MMKISSINQLNINNSHSQRNYTSNHRNRAVSNISFKGDTTNYRPLYSNTLTNFVNTIKDTYVPTVSSSPLLQDGGVKLRIGYINDLHGQYKKLEKLASSLRDCDIRFSGGDNMIGDDRNTPVNRCVCKYLDCENIEASALGNHDVDMSEKTFKELTQNMKMKYMAANFKQDEASKNGSNVKNGAYIGNILVDSYAGEYKGIKYGVVGVAPVDLMGRVSHPDCYEDFKLEDMPGTIQTIQKETDKLKQQGINKIFLLSHVGFAPDQEIAKSTSGIDVIIGGHSHTYIQGVKQDKNLFYSKSNEPVIITNAEKDGNYFGKLDIEFDKNGIVTKVSNNLYDINNFHKNLIYKSMFEDIVGKAEHLGTIGEVIPVPKNRLNEESAHANFVAEAIREELGVDIGIVNAGNLRNTFEPGPIDSSDTKAISPFGDGMAIAPVSEKDIVETVKKCCKSVLSYDGKPGFLYTSGLDYTLSKSTGELLSMTYVDRQGNKREIDINNPDPNKIYRVGADDYILSGRDGMTAMNHLDEAEKKFDFSEDKLIADYIKHHNGPVNINQLGHIKVVD